MYKSWYPFFHAGQYTYLPVCQQFCSLISQNLQTIVKLFISCILYLLMYILYLLMYGSFPKFWKYVPKKDEFLLLLLLLLLCLIYCYYCYYHLILLLFQLLLTLLMYSLSLDKNCIQDTVICLGVETIDGVNQISLLIFQTINGSTIVGLPQRSFAACAYM